MIPEFYKIFKLQNSIQFNISNILLRCSLRTNIALIHSMQYFIEVNQKLHDKRVQLPKLRHLSIYNYGVAIENMTT